MPSIEITLAFYMAVLAVLAIWMGIAESWLAFGLLVFVFFAGFLYF